MAIRVIHARITRGEHNSEAAFTVPALTVPVLPRQVPCSACGNLPNRKRLQQLAAGLGKNFPAGRENPETHMAGARAGHGSQRIGAERRRLWLYGGSDRIIHLELDRVRRVLEIVHLLPFQLDIRLDEIAAEYIAFHQEGMVGLQFAQRVAQ
jgi:hypothetical protein